MTNNDYEMRAIGLIHLELKLDSGETWRMGGVLIPILTGVTLCCDGVGGVECFSALRYTLLISGLSVEGRKMSDSQVTSASERWNALYAC